MSKVKKILIGAIAVVLIAVISFVGAFLWLRHTETAANAEQTKKETKKETIVVHKLAKDVTTNLQDSPDVMVRASAEIEVVEDKKLPEELKENDGEVYDIINLVLRSTKVDEARQPDAHIKIGEEITKKLNEAYHTDKFIAVHFKEFITQ